MGLLSNLEADEGKETESTAPPPYSLVGNNELAESGTVQGIPASSVKGMQFTDLKFPGRKRPHKYQS